MNDLEDLVRAALTTAPGETSIANPVELVGRRVRRARRRLAVATGLGLIAVAAAIIVPLTTIHSGGAAKLPVTRTPPAKPSSVPATTWRRGVEDVAVGDDGSGTPAVWAHLYKGHGQGQTTVIVKLDPRTGSVLQRVDVPQPASFIAIALGRVWTWGGGDGAYPDAAMSRVDPSTGEVTTLHLASDRGLGGTPYFIGNSAYYADGDSLVRFGGATGPLRVEDTSIPVPGGPTFPAPDGTIWVQGQRDWVHVSVSDSGVRVLERVNGWHGSLLNAGPTDGTFWQTDTRPDTTCRMRPVHLSFEPTSISASYGEWLPTEGFPTEVINDPTSRGIYLVTDGHCQPSSLPGLAFYSNDALQSGAAEPTSDFYTFVASSVRADPAGGLLFLSETSLMRWDPLQK